MISLATLHRFTVIKGTYYELRFRVKNTVDWSDYSPTVSFIASDSPSEPKPLTLVSFSSTAIQIDFDLSTIDDGGIPLVSYGLELTDDIANGFTKVTSYNSGDSSHTLSVVNDFIEEGKIYTIRWYAENAKGEGVRSDEILVALMNAPVAPASLWKESALSSQSAITVEWDPVTPGLSPGGDILGYKLYVKNPTTSIEWLAFDGYNLGLAD